MLKHPAINILKLKPPHTKSDTFWIYLYSYFFV